MGTQEYRHMGVATSLGDDVLIVRDMTVAECLGMPFEFTVHLRSELNDISHEDLLGENMTVRLDQPQRETRFFNGYVSEFMFDTQMGGQSQYTAILRPSFWFLSKTRDCRIFQDATVLEIIKEIFDDRKMTQPELKLNSSYGTREYCVQYRESDFSFISRLMEQEGIYYYFKHENGKHKMVLADGYASHDFVPGCERFPYNPNSEKSKREEHFRSWNNLKALQSGSVELTDYDFKQPGDDLTVRNIIAQEHSNAELPVFDYPGEHDKYPGAPAKKEEGTKEAQRRMEAMVARYESVSGTGNVRGLGAGDLFSLSGHSRSDQNREYLIVSSNIKMQNNALEAGSGEGAEEGGCTCSIVAIESKLPFRPVPATPKAVMRGPQTAVVTGKKGEEIDTDAYGRVRVQFHWDRHVKDGKPTSCWVRVSQTAAGRGWGAMSVPRIGQEVIVDFLEGDPDRPIITGRVYNGANMPPYKLPEHATRTTFKSNSTRDGQGGFNEFRFEDKKGAEQIFIHAEKDQDIRVKNDRREWIGHDTHETVVGERFEQVKHKHLTVTESLRERARNVSLTVDEEQHEKIGRRYAMQAGQEVHITAGSKIVLEAGSSVTLKVGGSFLTVTPSGISASGTINLNSGGSAASGGGIEPEDPTLPHDADDDTGGAAATAPPRRTAVQAAFDKRGVEVMLSASAQGLAFCEQCMQAVPE